MFGEDKIDLLSVNDEDLLTECKKLSKALNISNVSEGHHDKCTIINAIWRENDREIKAMLSGKKKVKDIWEDNRTKRNDLTICTSVVQIQK